MSNSYSLFDPNSHFDNFIDIPTQDSKSPHSNIAHHSSITAHQKIDAEVDRIIVIGSTQILARIQNYKFMASCGNCLDLNIFWALNTVIVGVPDDYL